MIDKPDSVNCPRCSGIKLVASYRQPLRIWEFLFGLMRRSRLDGADVVATGWYRRAPTPFVELRNLTADGVTRNCYVIHVKWVVSLVLVVLGVFLWMRGGLGG